MAVFKLTTSAFFECDLDFELLSEALLILPHLLHSQPKSLFRLNDLASGLPLVSFPPLVKLLGKALKVVDQRLDLSVGPIALILQLLDLLADNFVLKVKLVLELEELVRDRRVVLALTFLLAFAEELLGNGHGFLISQPIHDLSH